MNIFTLLLGLAYCKNIQISNFILLILYFRNELIFFVVLWSNLRNFLGKKILNMNVMLDPYFEDLFNICQLCTVILTQIITCILFLSSVDVIYKKNTLNWLSIALSVPSFSSTYIFVYGLCLELMVNSIFSFP